MLFKFDIERLRPIKPFKPMDRAQRKRGQPWNAQSIRDDSAMHGFGDDRITTLNVGEDFIDRAATKSSLSGLAYQIRCKGSAAVPSGQWLYDALTLYRRASQK